VTDDLDQIKTEAREKAREFLYAQVANKQSHGAGWDERQLTWLMVSFWQRGMKNREPNPDSDDEIEWWLANNYGPHVNVWAWTYIQELRSRSSFLEFAERMPADACAATISYITEAFGTDKLAESIVSACWKRLVDLAGTDQATYMVFGNNGPDPYIDAFLAARGGD